MRGRGFVGALLAASPLSFQLSLISVDEGAWAAVCEERDRVDPSLVIVPTAGERVMQEDSCMRSLTSTPVCTIVAVDAAGSDHVFTPPRHATPQSHRDRWCGQELCQMNSSITAIKDAIVRAVPLEKLYLFGSYANGTADENSDYDFYMVLPNDGMRPLDAINGAYMALRGMKRKPADILAGTVDVFSRRSEGVTLERKIAREGVVLYERDR